jgi:hypothetical protein
MEMRKLRYAAPSANEREEKKGRKEFAGWKALAAGGRAPRDGSLDSGVGEAQAQ